MSQRWIACVVVATWFFKDRATAGEIIAQTAQTLDNGPALSKSAR